MQRSAGVALVIYRDTCRKPWRSAVSRLFLWRPATAGPTSGLMLISWVDLLIAVAGLLLMVLAANPKLQKVGEIALLCGLMATCFLLGGKTVHFP